MKRFIVLAVACALMCSAAIANATEFEVSGQFDLTLENVDNGNFSKTNTGGFEVYERFRSQIKIIQSENLSGVVYFEIGDATWGATADGAKSAQLGTDGINVETRRAYVNFVIPNTPVIVSAGLMGLTLPNAVAGSPVFNDDVAAATVSLAQDNYSVTAFFARASSDGSTVSGHNYGAFETGKEYNPLTGKMDATYTNDIVGGVSLESLDLYGVIGAVDFGNISVSPYAVYANGKGKELNGEAVPKNEVTLFWLGTAIEANVLENLELAADVIYSDSEIDFKDGGSVDGSGFFLAGSASYKTEFVTPKVTAWWAEGADSNDLGFTGFAGWFGPTSLGFDGGTGRTTMDVVSCDGVGTTGVALSFADISFVEGVKHELILAYYELTVDSDGDAPSATEVDFITDWQMYENLSATLELAYVMPDWKYAAGENDNGEDIEKDAENMFKSAVSLKYAF